MKLKDKLSRIDSKGLGGAPPRERERSTQQNEAEERVTESLTVTESVTASESASAAGAFAEGSLNGDDRSTRISRLRAQMELMRGRVKEAPQKAGRAEPDEDGTGEEESGLGLGLGHVMQRVLPGEVHESAFGTLRRVVTVHDEDHCHGSIPVALALESSAKDLAILALDPTLEVVDFTRALYIDTETTGLAGGSGTLAFLIGMAWFEERKLVVEQLVLERPGLEAPMLSRLGELLSQASCIISYNGKSFDWPLLRTRFILNRVRAPKIPAHLDLLHCARRVYKRRLGAVRLVHLEQEILGFERIDDISGELIPETYLGFVRGRVPGAALGPIVDHNRSDLVALAAILGELVRRFRGELPAQDARDQLGFANVAARADDHARALAFAHAAVEADVRGELAPEALILAGELKLKASDLAAAVRAFEQCVELAAPGSHHASRAHLALAKLHEHKLRDVARALEHARHTGPAEGELEQARRVARLERKRGSTDSLF